MNATLPAILQWRALHQPDRPAYTFLADGELDARSLTYGELDQQARAIAATLQARQLAGQRALLLFPTGLEFLAAFLGCLYANVTAIPAPAQFDDARRSARTLPRLRAIIEDAGAAIVLADPATAALGRPLFGALPWLEGPEAPAAEWRAEACSDDDLAFLQYSSGSTGTPKGVMVSHANLRHNLAALQRAFGHDEHSISVSWLPAYHDMGLVADLLQPLFVGYHAVFMSPFDFIKRPLRWLEAISRYQATTSGAPNFAYALCANKVRPEELSGLDLSAWEVAYNCAEPVRAEDLDRFGATFAPCGFRREAFFPYLGMAEATLMVSAGSKQAAPVCVAVSREALQQGRIELDEAGPVYVGCGRGLPDQLLRIVAPETGLACDDGTVGEVWVAGPSVTRGYWRKPAENEAQFGAWLGQEGPFLRTGDLGFLLNGELFLTGRLKDLIIIQGQNHYPQDLERTAEAAHALIRPGCSAAFAVDIAGQEQVVLVAEVAEPYEDGLAAAVQAEIFEAHQLVVGTVVLLPAGTLPKTSSGKVQRRACKAALEAGSLPALQVVVPDGPSSEQARMLASLFAELLGLDHVAVTDRFFELGGHSLLATRLIARLRDRLGVELPLQLLFEAPTPLALAQRLSTLQGCALPPLVSRPSGCLSFAQERMWFMEQWQPGSPLYVMPTVLRVEGPLDAARLEAGLGALVERHAVLRTRFVAIAGGQVEQAVEAAAPFGLTRVEAGSQAEARDLALAAAQAPFDLARAPLLRATLIRYAPTAHLLVLSIHHIACDGWSLGVITRELRQLYASQRLDPLPVQYTDYAAWQRDWLQGETLQRQVDHWRGALAGAPALLPLPTDRPRPATESFRGAELYVALDATLTAKLQRLAREAGVTPFMVLLAAFQALLHRHTRATDLCVGIPVANRRMKALEPLVGFFVNTLVVRAQLEGTPSFGALLQQTKERCLAAYAHQDVPFEKLVEALKPRRDVSHHPLFQVMFILQEGANWRLDGLEVVPEAFHTGASKFDLTLELIPRDGGLAARFEYNRDLFDEATVARLGAHYERVLREVAAAPDVPLASLLAGEVFGQAAAAPVLPTAPGPQAPQTADEELLCALFAEVLVDLEIPSVDVHESFFDLGGHSLLATRLAARIRETFHVELPLRKLFEAPSVAGLAAIVRDLQGAVLVAPVARAGRSEPLPLSFAQERLWFMEQMLPGSGLYVHAAAFDLVGALDADALERAFQAVIARHETLRTRFLVLEGGEARQVVDAEAPFTLELLDGRLAADAQALAFAGAHAPFDLAVAPLLRARVVALAVDRHVLVLTVHHLVVDGWSLGLLLEELAGHYAAYVRGVAPALAPPKLQYGDYVAWQRDALADDAFAPQLRYWRDRLAHAPTLLPLPTDRPRPAFETFRGAKLDLALGLPLTQRLEALAKQEGVTSFMLLLAAFQVLLYRYSHQTDVCVGVPYANRRLADMEGVLGLFVNTLVLRGDLEGAPRFRDFLQQIKERCLDADDYQDLPFEKLVEALNPERSPSHHPLFQVMFALQGASSPGWAAGGLTATTLELGSETAKFDLGLDLTPGDDGLVGRLDYNRDLFDHATIVRLAGHFSTLLEAIAAAPDTSVAELPLLTPAERQQLLVDWNQTRVDYPKDACIHQLIAAQVERTPGAIAVQFEGESLTYQALDARANQLAHHLRALGVGPDVLIGLCVERSLALVVAVLAILKAGGAYVPLDPTYPSERVSFMVRDAGMPLVLAQASTLALFTGEAARVILVDGEGWGDQPDTAPEAGVTLDHLISVIYTSGSTGKPKGVLNKHLGVYNHLVYRQSAYQMTPDDRIMQKTSINFDGSVWELFWPLMVGARLHLAKPSAQKDGSYLCDFIQQHGITMIDFVPSMLFEVLHDARLQQCRSLRRFFVGGESLTYALQQAFYAKLDQAALTHGYGPTETTVSVIYYDCHREDPRAVVPIGRPIANTRLYVLDAHLQPVPVGVAGELHIGGDGLARGYHDRPELTAERFIPDPFTPGERLYKSGDLVRYLPDGNLEFLGRVDHQVKLRGFRIELGEIEGVLAQHAAVREVVVLAREDRPGDKRLVAYVVAKPGPQPTPAALRTYLAAQLPDHMVPAAFVFLDRIPLTHNEKIDRRALPAPDGGRDGTAESYVAPTSPQEAALCDLFSEILGVRPVGIHDGFFELGGHSLLATRLVSRIRERLQVELPLRALFEAPTVARLAASVLGLQGRRLPPIAPAPRNAPPWLSFAQERLWFMDQLAPDRALYNIPAAYRLDGPLDREALARSFAHLVTRHEALRTRFDVIDGQAVQLIDPDAGFALTFTDLSRQPDPHAEALAVAQQDANRPFDLQAGPLMRVQLLKLAEDAHVLVLGLHHIVSDGWSWRVMLQELAGNYARLRAGDHSAPPPLPIQYADYAAWQRGWLQGEVFDTQLAYWKHRLAGAPALLSLPTDRPRPAVARYEGARVEFHYDLALTERLQAVARREGVTPFMLLLAAFQVLL
ncbi:MAG: Malonyl CoA-acyl carrier protein transacylase, partial [Cyanobacteria bacterium RYN_339]|nr:Malonyl CoA-acyl carrier protein transacylase [Cyanobacteria bacterium RYN_339]